MDMLPQDGRNYVVDCPHSLQCYVGCSDRIAKTLARLFYELAIDPTTLDFISRSTVAPEHAALFLEEYASYVRNPTTSYRQFLDMLYDYDIFASRRTGDSFLNATNVRSIPKNIEIRKKNSPTCAT